MRLRICPVRLRVYVRRLCACARRHFLQPRACVAVLVGKRTIHASNGYPGREKPWRQFPQRPPDGGQGSQLCLTSHLGRPGLFSLPIPQWPGRSGCSHWPRADAGPLNPSAPSPQCKRRRERGRELGARKDPKGRFGELPWWSLDAGRWTPVFRAGCSQDPWTRREGSSTLKTRGTLSGPANSGRWGSVGRGRRFQEVEEGDGPIGWSNLQSSGWRLSFFSGRK